MDEKQVEKWALVKDSLEKAGKTDSFFYKRACAVVTTGRDPGPEAFFTPFKTN